jgi:hypothetical protein
MTQPTRFGDQTARTNFILATEAHVTDEYSCVATERLFIRATTVRTGLKRSFSPGHRRASP